MQSRENLNPTSLVQRLVPEANVLSRDYHANSETCVRVRTSTAFNYQGPFKPLTFTSTIIPIEIWDCPGNITVETLAPLSQFATMIFVIDIRVGRVITGRFYG
jgi:hypothetical protein